LALKGLKKQKIKFWNFSKRVKTRLEWNGTKKCNYENFTTPT